MPAGDKFEARVRGPNVTPGYWRQPEQTRGRLRRGGLLPTRRRAALCRSRATVSKGFYFDGRIAEDFKLATGTWVAVGPLRTALHRSLRALHPGRRASPGSTATIIAALVFLDVEHCRALAKTPTASLADLAADPTVRALFAERLATLRCRRLQAARTASSGWCWSAEAPSIDSAELTDKGSVNQRAVLANRAALVERLFAADPPAEVIRL